MTTELISTAAALRRWRLAQRDASRRVAFVPTMGALHDGHRSLMRAGRDRADVVAVSVFVNPTQFGPNEDFARYPRDLDGDLARCAEAGVDLVFAPPVEEIYPPGDRTTVHVEGLTEGLCGASRPGHFQGVTTVVARLFHLVQPDVALFGQKDYQQLAVLRQMTRDLRWDIEIVGVPTARDHDGLALSSRNRYLSDAQRAKALSLSAGLRRAAALAAQGERRADALLQAALDTLPADDPELRVEYLALVHPDTLQPLDRLDSDGVLLVAAHVGATRLIDNLRLTPGDAQEPS